MVAKSKLKNNFDDIMWKLRIAKFTVSSTCGTLFPLDMPFNDNSDYSPRDSEYVPDSCPEVSVALLQPEKITSKTMQNWTLLGFFENQSDWPKHLPLTVLHMHFSNSKQKELDKITIDVSLRPVPTPCTSPHSLPALLLSDFDTEAMYSLSYGETNEILNVLLSKPQA